MSDRPPMTPPPTASLQDVLDALENASPSSRQFGINILNDMIRSNLLLSNSESVDVVEPLEIDDSALRVFPSDPQELLWDELMVEPSIDYATLVRFSSDGKNPPCVVAGLAAGCGYVHILREVFPSGNADGVDALLQEGADAYVAEHKASLPPPPPSSSTEGKAIRTYVKNTLSRSRAKDVAYIQNRFMFKPDPEPVSTVHSPTFGFYKRAWSEVRCAHNRALYTKLLARDQQGFYAFLSHPLFQSVVSGFINARSLDGKVDRHSIQTYVGVILLYLIGQMKTGMETTGPFSKQEYGNDVAILRGWASRLVPVMGQQGAV